MPDDDDDEQEDEDKDKEKEEEAEEEEGEWTVIKKTKGKKGKQQHLSLAAASSPLTTHGLRDHYNPAQIDAESTRLLHALQEAMTLLLPTTFYTHLEEALRTRLRQATEQQRQEEKEGGEEGERKEHKEESNRPITALICYGLGSIQSTTGHPLWQLACACLLKDRLLSSSPVVAEAYDPLFDSTDKHLLHSLGWIVLGTNEGAKRKVEKPTLFFMPCCHRQLYSNLLWANWSPSSLPHVLLVGNSLRSYEERALASEKGKNNESDCVLPLLPWVNETKIGWTRKKGEEKVDERVVKTAFVDLCVTDFPALPPAEGEGEALLWTRRPPELKEEKDE